MRKALATQTLLRSARDVRHGDRTYNPPSRKMQEMATFFEVLSCSFQMTNSGISSIRTSVASSEDARARYICPSLIVLPPPLASQL